MIMISLWRFKKTLDEHKKTTNNDLLSEADSLNNMSAYFLVELEYKQLLVNVTKEFIESRELSCKFTGRKQVIGNNLFIKAPYTI